MMEAYQQLEKEWADYNSLDPAGMVACASGTAALHLALEAFRLPPGSEVIVPDFTMVACARAVTLAGLTPVFVDCDERLLMDFGLIPPCSTTLKAIMFVHVYGRRWPVEWMSPNWAIKRIEDLAEAHGVKPSEHSDAACWSFFRNKIIFGQEGGAVWFRDHKLATLARELRCLGFTARHDFNHVPRGHNYRLSNAHAEMVLTSLRLAPAYLCMRRIIEGQYEKHCPEEWRMPPRDAPWVYDLRLPWGSDLDEVVMALREAGIEARHSFKPMHLQEEYRGCRFVHGWREGKNGERLPNPSLAYTRVMYLPIQPGVTREEDCRRAFDVIKRALGK